MAASRKSVEELKEELLEYLVPLKRGVAASPEEKAHVDELASALEAVTPNKKSLASPLINGKWELLYTTSDSILGTSRPAFLRPNGPIHQFIDAENLKARNQESWPFWNSVYADLTPETGSRVAVKFTQFRIGGLIPITAPDSARGKLDTTFVDETLRISRGDKGNLFILRQKEPSGRP